MAITREGLIERLQEILQPDRKFKSILVGYDNEELEVRAILKVTPTVPTTEEPN